MPQTLSLRSNLRPALISSFCVSGYSQAFKHWPRGVAIDLYCFMQGDLNGADAAAYLATLSNSPTRVEKTADAIIRAYDKARRHELIVAVSSFLPRISTSSRNGDEDANAINPVVGLINLARALRKRNHPVHTIELVGGTRITGLWHGKWSGPHPHPSGKSETFCAFREADPENPVKQLAARLGRICSNSNLTLAENLRLAVELEPGPLYVVNTFESLSCLQREVSVSPLAGIVGFNLDIAHWQLAHFRTNVLGKYSNLLQYVVHSHISDHAKGHFGDVPIGDLGFQLDDRAGIEERLMPFRDWLDLLAGAWFGPGAGSRPCGKSGYVSIEMEACRSMDAVQQSVRVLRGLLSE